MTPTKKEVRIAFAAIIATTVAATTIAYAQGGKHGPRAQHLFERMDTNSDQVVTQDEVATHTAARFAELDLNSNGVVEPTERKQARQNRSAERFARLDANNDGAVTRAEAAAVLGDRAERRFDRMDINGDGSITADEAKNARGKHKGGKRRHGGQAKGPVTLQQMQERAADRFTRIDADQNGVVTLEEAQNAPRLKKRR